MCSWRKRFQAFQNFSLFYWLWLLAVKLTLRSEKLLPQTKNWSVISNVSVSLCGYEFEISWCTHYTYAFGVLVSFCYRLFLIDQKAASKQSSPRARSLSPLPRVHKFDKGACFAQINLCIRLWLRCFYKLVSEVSPLVTFTRVSVSLILSGLDVYVRLWSNVYLSCLWMQILGGFQEQFCCCCCCKNRRRYSKVFWSQWSVDCGKLECSLCWRLIHDKVNNVWCGQCPWTLTYAQTLSLWKSALAKPEE